MRESARPRRPRWRDEQPERFGTIEVGDYAVVRFLDGIRHFVQVTSLESGPAIAREAACGTPTPPHDGEDILNREQMVMAGVVDCPECLVSWMIATGPSAAAG